VGSAGQQKKLHMKNQSRLKFSGQLWSIRGVNAIANLRCLYKSQAWHIVEKFVNADA